MPMQRNKIQVALVDDHPALMEGLKTILLNNPDVNIAGCFVTGDAILNYVGSYPVDIVLLDIALPDISGIALCLEIRKKAPSTMVLVFSNHSERSIIMQAIQNGASGYLLKNTSPDELKSSIQDVMDGKVVFSREVQEIISRPSKNELAGPPRLTRREKQVIQLLSEGKTSLQIAAELSVSALTIDTHRRNLMQKFAVKNTAALIKVAILHRFI